MQMEKIPKFIDDSYGNRILKMVNADGSRNSVSQDEFENCRDGHDAFPNHKWIDGKCIQCGILQDAFGYYEIWDLMENICEDVGKLKRMIMNHQQAILIARKKSRKEDNKK